MQELICNSCSVDICLRSLQIHQNTHTHTDTHTFLFLFLILPQSGSCLVSTVAVLIRVWWSQTSWPFTFHTWTYSPAKKSEKACNLLKLLWTFSSKFYVDKGEKIQKPSPSHCLRRASGRWGSISQFTSGCVGGKTAFLCSQRWSFLITVVNNFMAVLEPC